MSEVKLISMTQPMNEELKDASAEHLIVYCARVSNPKNQTNFDTSAKLLNYCLKHGHVSIFEQASMTVEIKTSRAISAQILRHRSFCFQEFCISGDSKISCIQPSGKIKLRKIEDLYKLQSDPKWSRLVRVYDESTRQLIPVKVKEVFDTGVKPVYEIELENGKKIKSTLDHKFITKDNWSRLENLQVGDIVGCNGIPKHQDYDWLKEAKQRSIELGGGVSRIAEEAGVSYHTIRKWLKKHNLTFSREEVSKYTTVWNKGLPKEKQPKFGKVVSEETREKMSKSARSGEDSNLYIDGRSKDRPWNQKVWDWQFTQKRRLEIETGKYCKSCGETENLEIDHKLPKNQHPELAFDYNNLQFLCKPCHKKKTALENQTITWSKIKSITYVGEEQTYDMEVDHESHNYVANGIITHNSQRYAEVQECETYSARRQDEKNRQNSIDDLENEAKTWFDVAQQRVHDEAQKLYNEALELGIAKEQARFLLPMSASTTLYMTGSVRSWIHYLKTRLANGTQQEHIEIAEQIAEIFKKQFPNVYKAAFGGE